MDHTQQPNHARSTWLERGKAYIDQHYTERITIQDTANYVGVNRSYFSEQFSTIYGIAPIKYLQKLRLEGKRCYAPPLTVSQKSPYH
nr:AraC family transcriptional regulator [Gracilibacillus alcaliphilus]